MLSNIIFLEYFWLPIALAKKYRHEFMIKQCMMIHDNMNSMIIISDRKYLKNILFFLLESL